MTQRGRRQFTAEQKTEAIRVAREHESIAAASRSLGIGETTLGRWVAQADIDEGHGEEGQLASDEKSELQRLRKDNRRLQMERDFLERAVCFFAKDSDRPSS